MIYIGIDNGVSGSVGTVNENREVTYCKMPVFKYLDYPKTKAKWIHRIDVNKLHSILKTVTMLETVRLFLERPMINPQAFNASMSAIRALEATLIIIEKLGLSHQWMDSKEWQNEMLPKARKTKVNKKGKTRQVIDNKIVKDISLEVGKRLFPSIKFDDLKFKDADGLLIAEYARRNKK